MAAATTRVANQAINLPNTAGTIEVEYHAPDNAAGGGGDNDDDNDEGVPRKTLVTATILRKANSADADIPEGGA
jgi:hypothetical protein